MAKVIKFPSVKKSAYQAGYDDFYVAVEEDGIPDEVIPPAEYAADPDYMRGWDAGLIEFKARMRQIYDAVTQSL